MANDIRSILDSVNQMAQPAKPAYDGEEGDPGEVTATTETKGGAPLIDVKMKEADANLWWQRIERARQRRKSREESWDLLLDEYMPVVSKSGEAETVKVQAHFRNVHTKLGSLFYRSPDLILTADEPGPAANTLPMPPPVPGQPPQPPRTLESIISLKQAVLKKTLGRDGIKVERLMDEMLFDVLAWSGFSMCKVGYRAVMKVFSNPVMGDDPNHVPPTSMLGLSSMPVPQVPQIGPDGQPLMQQEQQPIFEEYYARRLSPKKALWDDTLRSTRFDEDATWMGMDFFISPKRAMKEFGLTEEEANKAAEDDRVHKYKGDEITGQRPKLVHCVEIYCKASVYTDDQPHPQAMRQLVMIEGKKDAPVVWRASPDQTFDEKGKLTTDSLIGFPYKVLTIRDLADSCFPPSDSAITNSDIKQMSTYRRQTIRLRDASIGKWLYDTSAFGTEELEQLKNGDIGEFIGVEDGKLKDGVDTIFVQTSKIQGSADDQRGFQGIKQDMNESLGVGANQAGTETDTVRTATEASTVAHAVQARNDKELGRVIDFYLDLARGVDQLLMRYMDNEAYVDIGGTDAASNMQAWDNTRIMLKCLYDIAPDSQLRPDTAQDFVHISQYYNLTAHDELSNRSYILKKMARMRGFDPAKAVLPPPPPAPPKLDPPKISLALSAIDLHDPTVMAFIAQYGGAPQPAPPPGAAPVQPPHGGPVEPAKVVSQHMQSNSGLRPNEPGAANHRETQVK